DPMPLLGRILPGRIMLQIDPRQAALFRRKDLGLIDFVVFAGLKQDAIEIFIANLFDGNVMNVRAKGKCRAAAAVTFAHFWRHGQIEFGPSMRQIEQVIAVNVPGQNSYTVHGATCKHGASFAFKSAVAAPKTSSALTSAASASTRCRP